MIQQIVDRTGRVRATLEERRIWATQFVKFLSDPRYEEAIEWQVRWARALEMTPRSRSGDEAAKARLEIRWQW